MAEFTVFGVSVSLNGSSYLGGVMAGLSRYLPAVSAAGPLRPTILCLHCQRIDKGIQTARIDSWASAQTQIQIISWSYELWDSCWSDLNYHFIIQLRELHQ